MKVTTTAATSFVHGNRKYEPGDPVETTKGEADELRAAGLVGDGMPDSEPQAPAEPSAIDALGQDDYPREDFTGGDMLGGEEMLDSDAKMEGETENKMDPAPKNKAAPKTSSKAK